MLGAKKNQIDNSTNGLKMKRFVDVMKILGIVIGTLLVLAIVVIIVNETRMAEENEDKAAPVPIATDDGAGVSLPISATKEDETIPSEDQMSSYTVAANKPRYIRIPDLGVYARVVEIGIQDDALGVPSNIHDAGWYYQSVLPGKNGAVLMDGHGGGGNYPEVVFDKLGNLNTGALIEIEMGNGKRYKYMVEEKRILSISEADAYMEEMLQVVGDGTRGLNLISCTGTWMNAEQTLDKRVMIRAIEVEE